MSAVEDASLGGLRTEEERREAENPERRIVQQRSADLQAAYDNVESEVPDETKAFVKQMKDNLNKLCERCGDTVHRSFKGCANGHLACQSCHNKPELLQTSKRTGLCCSVNFCKASIPPENWKKKGISTIPDAEKNANQKEREQNYMALLSCTVAHVLLTREKEKSAAIRAHHVAMQRLARQGGEENNNDEKKTRKGIMHRHARENGLPYDDLESERKTPSRDTPDAVKRALQDALDEWEEVNPRKKAKLRAEEKAEEKAALDKENEKLAELNAQLQADNDDLRACLHESEEKIKALIGRKTKLREKLARCEYEVDRLRDIIEKEMQGIANGASSSSGAMSSGAFSEPMELDAQVMGHFTHTTEADADK